MHPLLVSSACPCLLTLQTMLARLLRKKALNERQFGVRALATTAYFIYRLHPRYN
ncbi:hypothetical protein PRUB_a4627 [Pseudoalteromonas rubra]|uniref:Uncharacterized protein n=1 Tax=Pseudoalteromonas rubra TaxID=43658 RepID=A0A8T0C9T7_9GAMM|nr:hypothetical protein PRUB_a4627 [Pseudoalteromonas rubra]